MSEVNDDTGVAPEETENEATEEENTVEFEKAGIVELPKRRPAAPAGRPTSLPRATRPAAEPPKPPSPELPAPRSILTHPAVLTAAYLVLLLVISLIVDIGLIPARGILGSHPTFAADLANIIEAVAAIVAMVVMMRFVERRPLKDAGFDPTGIARQVGLGAALGAGLAVVTMWMMSASESYVLTGPHARLNPFAPLLVCLAYAIAESVVLYGYVFRVFEYRFGSLAAFGATAAVSTIVHAIGSGEPASKMFDEAVIALSTGFLLTTSYAATRRLWLPIAIQWAWTFFAGPVFGMDLTSMGIQTSSWCRPSISPGFINGGGDLGPLASLSSVIIWTAAGAFMLRYAILSGQWKPPAAGLPTPQVAVPSVDADEVK